MPFGVFEGVLGFAILAIVVLVIYKVIKVVIPLAIAVGIVAILYYTGMLDSLLP
jgi:hypothetical protein